MLHGTFLTEFEKYIDAISKTLDKVQPINRGEQAYMFLLTMFGLSDSKKIMSADISLRRLCDEIRSVRNVSFDAENYQFNEIITVFNELVRCTKIKEETALKVAAYIVRNQYNADNIVY